jgi:hypothetical protein
MLSANSFTVPQFSLRQNKEPDQVQYSGQCSRLQNRPGNISGLAQVFITAAFQFSLINDY